MKKNEYFEKLKDPRWQKKRLEILERDNWTCRYCGDTEKTLHVHHLFYIPKVEPWEIHNGFLLTLCERCHGNMPCDEGYEKCDECPAFKEDCVGTGNRTGEISAAIGWLLNSIWSGVKAEEFKSNGLKSCIDYLQKCK